MARYGLKWAAPAAGVNFVDGGSIAISAKRNVSGSGGYADVNDWLRRTTGTPGATLTSPLSSTRGFAYLPAYWWVDRLGNTTAKTKGIEGIATLGGGNIAIAAGEYRQQPFRRIRDVALGSDHRPPR